MVPILLCPHYYHPQVFCLSICSFSLLSIKFSFPLVFLSAAWSDEGTRTCLGAQKIWSHLTFISPVFLALPSTNMISCRKALGLMTSHRYHMWFTAADLHADRMVSEEVWEDLPPTWRGIQIQLLWDESEVTMWLRAHCKHCLVALGSHFPKPVPILPCIP